MSDPRPTARELAHAMEPMQCLASPRSQDGHTLRCTGRVTALESFAAADRAASDAREDRLREALEAIASNDEDFPPDNMHLRIARAALAGKPIPRCGCHVPGPGNGNSKCMAPMRSVCRCRCHRVVAAIPPGSDR